MRAVWLALALALLPAAAIADEQPFFKALSARGPQDLRVAEGLEGVRPDSRARASVENGVLVIEIQRGGEFAPEVFRYDGLPGDRANLWIEPHAELDFNALCRGGGTAEQMEIGCYSRAALRSRALRPPHTIWKLWLAPDGLRVVRQGTGGRLTLTPLNPTPKGERYLRPGLEANLGDALDQLAAFRDGRMYGGASGGGEWYGSDLVLRSVRGLDFVIERTVLPDRGGRSDQVPAIWSFDYQGPGVRGKTPLTWLMTRKRKGVREADFWCVGRPAGATVHIDCHRGGRPSDARGKADVAFKLEPYPEWRIYVEAGADNAFSSVGSTRLETLPFP